MILVGLNQLFFKGWRGNVEKLNAIQLWDTKHDASYSSQSFRIDWQLFSNVS